MNRNRSFNLRRPRSGGFTFTEVLFAVILLGIGFIMLAGIFPVAVQQTVTTAEETAANALAQRAVNQVAAIATSARFPSTGNRVEQVRKNEVWDVLAGGMIDEKNPRYAWVPMYRRDGDNRYMQLIVVALQAQHDGQVFEVSKDFRRNVSSSLVDPRPVKMRVIDAGNGVYEVSIGSAEKYRDACGEGAFLIDKNTGKYFRLGARVKDADRWTMAPGNDLGEEDVKDWLDKDRDALVIGRPFQYRDPAKLEPPFQGYVMDIGIYSTFILLK